MSEKALARAVIIRAIGDLFKYRKGEPVAVLSTLEAREAKDFLLADDSAWSRSRRLWCALADIDEDALRSTIRDRIERCK